ncbi:hypothetical protein DMW20_12075 [Vibrio parahaemolyticus]|nr:hypothetical protein [Vibrio parahaemolyticus]
MNKNIDSQREYTLKNGDTTTNLVTYIIDIVNGATNLSKMLGVSKASITAYEKRQYVPAIYAADIESCTKRSVTSRMICDEAKRFIK